MIIRRAREEDFKQMWPIFKEVVSKGDSYVFSPDTKEEEGFSFWFGEGITSYVAEENNKILGMYKLIKNQRDLGSHVANASFMVSPDHQGKGIGKAMGLHCLQEAKKAGFKAIQFNFVVSTNTPAVHLWESLGFKIVGTLPKAFNHMKLGLVDAYVMYRFLDDI
ncbi:MAG: GNAT family N-acetyltransferase [Tissierellia bacterium]|nr:GNAT family N-acetyltransferase [Tissierellia bacterium]